MKGSTSQFIAPRLGGFAERVALRVRKKIFADAMHVCRPQSNIKILDIGVTDDESADSNFFEKLYPYPWQITAVGLEDASFLEDQYPGLVFVKADACDLPFMDKAFDFAFCSAVIEHVGSRQRQKLLILEAVRVAKVVMISTPNKWYPIEFHTLTPFLHWLPPRVFRFFLKVTGRKFFSRESNLNLLSAHCIENMCHSEHLNFSVYHQTLLGMTSNLVYTINDYSVA
ncbi:Methyltransferase domain protein [Prochlorococcus marinus str. MIT 1313]|uniref:methyltransferase domain-containing protein n=1 Tax=Prochlorococcus TaxID=1218 RepID=UPI0007B3E60E|nr:methyltransferase domain-containing protein [Prochlorococcus marinus]KZR70113.1 Methyltransferase domain protein [Prochlorococcus marinus str. MIT 1313]